MKADTMYRILVGTVFVLLITIVMYVGLNITEKKKEPTDIAKEPNQDVVVDNKDVKIYNEPEEKKEEKINVVAKYIDIYSECPHELNTSEQYYNTTMDNVKNAARNNHPEYSLSEESGNILVFERSYKGKCPNHFLVKIEDKNLCIYKINATGGYDLYQKTEIASEFLREDLQKRLTAGVKVDGLSNLFMLLEDIEI